MATSCAEGLSPAARFEILDLRHFSASSLRGVLEEESRLWSERLHWDYRSSADLLLQYLDSRVLPGYVALEDGRVAGYVFCVYEDRKSVIGDVFAAPRRPGPLTARDVETRLLEHLIETLQHSPGTDRIEAQLLLHPHDAHGVVFRSTGFSIHERLFLEHGLGRGLHPAPAGERRPLPEGLVLRPWHESDFNAAGRLIAESYQGHLDSRINDQYRTVSGSLRFLHNVVRFPGCGYFDPVASSVLVRASTGELAGILLCSRVCEDVGHVTQLCVAPEQRGSGLGEQMLHRCIDNLGGRNFAALTLTVTAQNEGALRLYRRLGFQQTHSFDAMMWERRRAGY